jgi:hypothetical protein
VLCAHYPREDALLVAACDLVPRSRASARAWRAQLPAFLGFYQWQRARAAAHAAALAEAEALGASGGDEGASEELGAAAPADENGSKGGGPSGEGADAAAPGDEAAADAPEEGAADAPEGGGGGPAASGMALPPRPPRVFDVDAGAAALLEEEEVLHAWGAPPVRAGRSRAGRYVRAGTARHSLALHEGPEGCAPPPHPRPSY